MCSEKKKFNLDSPFSESGNNRRGEVKGHEVYVGIGGSGCSEGWFVLLPQYPVATRSHLAATETGVVKCWFQMLLLVGSGFGWSDPICAHNPDELTRSNLCMSHNQIA